MNETSELEARLLAHRYILLAMVEIMPERDQLAELIPPSTASQNDDAQLAAFCDEMRIIIGASVRKSS